MRSTHCRSNAFGSLCVLFPHPRTPERVPVLFRVWQPACSTGHRRCDPAGQVTRRLQASQCRHTIEFLTFSLMFETEAATVSTQERRTSPRSHSKSEWGSQLFGPHLLQTGKYAKIWFAENPGIVLIAAIFFLPGFSRNTRGFLFWALSTHRTSSCLFSEGVLGWICGVTNLSRWSLRDVFTDSWFLS